MEDEFMKTGFKAFIFFQSCIFSCKYSLKNSEKIRNTYQFLDSEDAYRRSRVSVHETVLLHFEFIQKQRLVNRYHVLYLINNNAVFSNDSGLDS